MEQKKEPNQSNNYLSLLALGFIFCSILLIFLAFPKPNHKTEGSEDFSSYSPSNENKLINKHLLKTTDDIEFQRLKNQYEGLKAMNSARETGPEKPVYNGENNFFDFEGDPRPRQLAEDVGRANDIKSVNSTTPQSIIYESMIREEKRQNRDYEKKVAAAKDFIERAKKDGWAVIIDKDFKIKSYQRMTNSDDDPEESEAKKFQGYNLFPSK